MSEKMNTRQTLALAKKIIEINREHSRRLHDLGHSSHEKCDCPTRDSLPYNYEDWSWAANRAIERHGSYRPDFYTAVPAGLVGKVSAIIDFPHGGAK